MTRRNFNSAFGLNVLIPFTQVLKVRLNLQQAGTYHGVVTCARSIYKHESMSSFYRGFKPSILCMIPYAGVECAVHQVRKYSQKTHTFFKVFETHHRILQCFFFLSFFFYPHLQSIMSWATRDPAYNSDSKLFFFSFVAFASGQITSYPLAVIRTQQQAQGKPQSDHVKLNLQMPLLFKSKSCLFSP